MLTESNRSALRAHLATSVDAATHDLRDLVDVLSGLGGRIGELLAVDWTRVDDVAGTIAIEGTVVRVPGRGRPLPSTRGTLRDPDNPRKRLREVVAGTEWEGPHPHAFRHLVATRLDAAGLSAREIADYLGHERVSMTQDVYMSRKSTGPGRGPRSTSSGREAGRGSWPPGQPTNHGVQAEEHQSQYDHGDGEE